MESQFSFEYSSEFSLNFISCFANRLFNVELKWFFIELSVLPGSSFAISAHLLPILSWFLSIIWSSSGVHFDRLISGFKWLCHLSRHCFPILPLSDAAIMLQFFAPYFSTISVTILSSSAVQGPLTSFGFNTFCHLCNHWTSVLFLKCEEILFPWFSSMNDYKLSQHHIFVFTPKLLRSISCCPFDTYNITKMVLKFGFDIRIR